MIFHYIIIIAYRHNILILYALAFSHCMGAPPMQEEMISRKENTVGINIIWLSYSCKTETQNRSIFYDTSTRCVLH